jgi:hypothetical protein
MDVCGREQGLECLATRRRFQEEIEAGDVVEVADYPESRDQRSVCVVRDERVMAIETYFWESGGWLGSGYSSCTGF